MTRHRAGGAGAYHAIGFGALEVFEVRPAPEHAPGLSLLYERGPCSLCCGRGVDQLHTLGALPHWMLEECCDDANADTRAKAQRWAGA